MPSPKQKPQTPPQPDKRAATDKAPQPVSATLDTAPMTPPLSTVTTPSLTYEQRRRLRQQLKWKYHG